jgi:hypothetical protein
MGQQQQRIGPVADTRIGVGARQPMQLRNLSGKINHAGLLQPEPAAFPDPRLLSIRLAEDHFSFFAGGDLDVVGQDRLG